MEIKNLDDVNKARLFGNSDFSNIINKSLKAIKNNRAQLGGDIDITDVPISPMCIDDDLCPILLSKEVVEEYEKLIKLCNNPETAFEYSFVLLGKTCKLADDEGYLIDKIINCSSQELHDREVTFDNDKINNAINYGVNNGYNFIAIGHTHPKVSLSAANKTVTKYLDDDTRLKEYIREPGLNISLQDFITYETLYRYFFYRQNIRTAQAIFMYNGEIALVSKQNTELRRFPIILNATSGEPLYVSSREEYKKRSL